MSLGTDEINSADTSEMNGLDTSLIKVLNGGTVKAVSLIWILSHPSCISKLILVLN